MLNEKRKKNLAAFIAVLTLLVCVLPASAATNENKLLDTSKKVSLTLNCNKAGYTFSVYKVATLSSTTNATKYTSTNSAYGIDDALNSGNSAALLKKLDTVKLSDLTANTVDTFASSATSTSKKLTNLEQGVYYVRVTKFPAGTTKVRNSVIALLITMKLLQVGFTAVLLILQPKLMIQLQRLKKRSQTQQSRM